MSDIPALPSQTFSFKIHDFDAATNAEKKGPVRRIVYKDYEPGKSLTTLRSSASSILTEGACFVDTEGELIPVEDEGAWPIEEACDVKTSPFKAVIWTKAYQDHLEKKNQTVTGPAESDAVKITVTRKPKNLGDKEKLYPTKWGDYNAMKVSQLREGLQNRKWIYDTDLFVDQGVAIEKDKEDTVDVKDIVSEDGDGASRKIVVEVHSKDHAKTTQASDKWNEYKPKVDASSYKVNLTKPTLSDFTPTGDLTSELGDGLGSVVIRTDGKPVSLSELTEAQQNQMLRNCRLYPRETDLATCAALMVNDRIEFSPRNGIVCKKINIETSPYMRRDAITVSYSETLGKWQSYLVEASKLGVCVPLTFEAQGGGGHSEVDERFESGVEVHVNKTLSLPKANITLENPTLSDELVKAIKMAVDAGSAKRLFDVFANYGYFVATSFVVGGKIHWSSSKVLTETVTRSELKVNFDASASAAVTAEGVPIEAGAGVGLEIGTSDYRKKIKQDFSVDVLTIGGFGEASSSKAKEIGQNWLITVATQPQTWSVIGVDGAIKPLLEYLPETGEYAGLKEKAKTLLRRYLESNLVLKKSGEMAGGGGGNPWSDEKLVRFGRRISKAVIMAAQNIDSIQFFYKDRGDGTEHAGGVHGDSVERATELRIDDANEITGVEIGWDKTIDHVVFHTKSGNNMNEVYGAKKGAKHTKVFREPRIRGFYGRAGHFLDAIGVLYYDLNESLPKNETSVLLALERYLYADQ